jgi:hypothetical protein
MHSPLFMYETEAQDRIDSYIREAQSWRIAEQARRATSDSKPADLVTQVRAAASRAAATIGTLAAKPSEPAEQCC